MAAKAYLFNQLITYLAQKGAFGGQIDDIYQEENDHNQNKLCKFADILKTFMSPSE